MSSVPASAAMPPDNANDMILIRLGATVDAAAMSWLSRTAIIERPIPVRRSRETTSVVTMRTPRAQVVETAPVGEVDAADDRRVDPRRARAELLPVNTGCAKSQFEHMTAKASVMTARKSPRTRNAGMPMIKRGRDADADGTEQRREPGHLEAHVPEVERNGDVVTRPEDDHRERAETDECGLTERQLSGPTCERHDRHRDEGEDDDVGPEELLRPLRQEQRQHEQETEQEREADLGQCRTYHRVRSRSGMGFGCADSDQPASSRRLRTTNMTRISAAMNR